MKFLLERYQAVSTALSLCILSLGFVIAADTKSCGVCVCAAFLAGALMYFIGSLREWRKNRLAICLLEALLGVCMLAAAILSLLRLGGLA